MGPTKSQQCVTYHTLTLWFTHSRADLLYGNSQCVVECMLGDNRGGTRSPMLVLTSTYPNSSLMFQVSHVDIETEKRLRKDLKRTKALLADAQIMLDHMKNNAPSKREIAQLKNQALKHLRHTRNQSTGPSTTLVHSLTARVHIHAFLFYSWKSLSSPVQRRSRPASPWRWRWRTCTSRWRTSPRLNRRCVGFFLFSPP